MTKVNQQELIERLIPFVRHSVECAYAATFEPQCICGLSKAMTDLQSLLVENERLREGVATIGKGSALGLSMFAERMSGKRHLTWYAVNVLQDNLEACAGTARILLGDSQP